MKYRIVLPAMIVAVTAMFGGVALAADPPNILVVWGDDIGQSNISAYTHGLMGYETPNIDRIAREGMTFTDYYGEQSCTAGRVVLHHGPERVPHRPVQGRPAGRQGGHAGGGSHHRHGAQGPGLRHRPVRQEPPRRPRRAPADQARLRRVLRQPLPPQRRGRARERGLPRRHGAGRRPDLPREVRPPRRDPLLGRAATASSASRTPAR